MVGVEARWPPEISLISHYSQSDKHLPTIDQVVHGHVHRPVLGEGGDLADLRRPLHGAQVTCTQRGILDQLHVNKISPFKPDM